MEQAKFWFETDKSTPVSQASNISDNSCPPGGLDFDRHKSDLTNFFQLVDAAGELLASVLIRTVGIQVRQPSPHVMFVCVLFL